MTDPDPTPRRVLAALRRLHRREPLRASFRLDRLLDELRAAPARRGKGHRGSAPLALTSDELGGVVDVLAASGEVVRDGRQVRLADAPAALDPVMQERVDRLLNGLREAGSAPPRLDGIAARLGIPPSVLDQLRKSGALVTVAPGIDYPRDTWERLDERIVALTATGPLNVARVRDALRTSRRHAEGLLAYRRAVRAARTGRDRRAVR